MLGRMRVAPKNLCPPTVCMFELAGAAAKFVKNLLLISLAAHTVGRQVAESGYRDRIIRGVGAPLGAGFPSLVQTASAKPPSW